ncbi:MAG: acetylornithine deacetylase [Polyangiaceae bacterium]|jgi:acetylornithine deacetylase|nr:acetylornithine deacetylase [Polyangiaceae bacterium]
MATELGARALEHLRWLVACDSQNPPRRPGALVDRLVETLRPRLAVEVSDLGEGCVCVYASRGQPRLLFNVHVDTVPVAPGWAGDPFALRVASARAYGLGACDIKGAAAALLAAIEASEPNDVALLFTTDEEAGQGRCVAEFVARRLPFEAVIVAEPTSSLAVVEHRGVATATALFRGRSGHSSAASPGKSALHALVGWAGEALAHAAAAEGRGGVRFNLGVVEGGQKPNMVAAEARARFGVRPAPGVDPARVLAEFGALPGGEGASFATNFVGPPLPPAGAPELAERARQIASALGLPPGGAVDFWTEAALFARAGYASLVFGPGDIARAHAPDEWVGLAELAGAAETYARVLRQEGALR